MNTMKKLFTLPLVMSASFAVAETQMSTQDNVLPQLSFELQQERAAELAKQAEERLRIEEEKRIAAETLQQAQQRILQEVGENSLQLLQATANVYSKLDFKPIWQDASTTKLFLKEYALFAASGVSAKSANALQQILNTPESFARDILLTDSFLDYLYYNKGVSQSANQWLYKLGSYKPKSPDENSIEQWVFAINNHTTHQFIDTLIPKNHIYQEMANMLFTMSPTSEIEQSGQKSQKTKSGKSKSDNAPVSFQKLALNAQRLRIIPSFNNGIFVNIPSYQLYYFRDGELVLQSKVIVGRNERRTPVMFSKLSNIVVNPPWNVPPTIKNKDLVPKMRRDPSYANSHSYEIIDSAGRKVDPYSINWAAYDNPNKNFPYHIRQKAGDDSALGRYKFNMPSSDAIYLHDTPNRGLFSKTNRALSSGCVRVAKSDELATLLLKEAGWSEQRKKTVLASKKTTSAQIRSDNPVYLYYVTAWVENGKIHSLPDIYRFDTNLPKVRIDWDQVKNVI